MRIFKKAINAREYETHTMITYNSSTIYINNKAISLLEDTMTKTVYYEPANKDKFDINELKDLLTNSCGDIALDAGVEISMYLQSIGANDSDKHVSEIIAKGSYSSHKLGNSIVSMWKYKEEIIISFISDLKLQSFNFC